LLPQLPVVHTFGDAQSPLTVQVVLHTRAVVSHPKGSHSELVTVRHTPAPSQVRAGVSVDPVQLPCTQTVPLAYCWHAPIPLQRPFVPQVSAPAFTHCVAGVGGMPAVMLVQVPGDAVSAHDWQVPEQAVAQQTPCAQKPEAHSVAIAQVRPSGFFEHVPPLQMLGATQSASAVHVVLHALAVVSQTYGLQGELAAAAHMPVPLHRRGGV